MHRVTCTQFPLLFSDPLSAAAAEHIEDFFHVRVGMGVVSLAGIHGDADHGEVSLSCEVFPHKPLMFLISYPFHLARTAGDKSQGVVH
jgi:hypothetical protein